MVNDELPAVSAVEAFRRYTQAFQALDPRTVARHFHQPALMITRERVIALPSGAAVEEAYGRVMARLPALGFVRTEFPSLAERRLGDDLAVVTGVSVWKDASGSDLQRFGLTRAEFLLWLPGATRHAPARIEGDAVTLSVDAGHVRITLRERGAALAAGPRRGLRVRGLDPAATEDFLAHFDAYTRRGGG